MIIHHVPIERRFTNPSEKHLVETDFLSSWNENLTVSFGWNDFKNNLCVIVLADGKCGKSHELMRQHKMLRTNGVCHFSYRLNSSKTMMF